MHQREIWKKLEDPKTSFEDLQGLWEKRHRIGDDLTVEERETLRERLALHPNLPTSVARALALARPEFLVHSPVLELLLLEAPDLFLGISSVRLVLLLRQTHPPQALLDYLRSHPDPMIQEVLSDASH